MQLNEFELYLPPPFPQKKEKKKWKKKSRSNPMSNPHITQMHADT